MFVHLKSAGINEINSLKLGAGQSVDELQAFVLILGFESNYMDFIVNIIN